MQTPSWNLTQAGRNGLSVGYRDGHGIALIDCDEDTRVSDYTQIYNEKAGLFIDAEHDIVISCKLFQGTEGPAVRATGAGGEILINSKLRAD